MISRGEFRRNIGFLCDECFIEEVRINFIFGENFEKLICELFIIEGRNKYMYKVVM